ncbi:UDP-N-acetylmuramoyl-L-alanyl-D-glutamate--2,6-diaminopimelate ligase [Alphaproteobacteria bacterium 46_93_T64]|nr:UDP-N-acetylmuramoyl-L-alanyl-D-glutamate--2,6-diaminopimelate ligase [Alphaproteobacteria bacterium 46_93_T64]
MRLSDLLGAAGFPSENDIEVTGLTADSRTVSSGFLFAALTGTELDGRKYIDAAINQGAVAILTDMQYDASNCTIYCHQVQEPRLTLAECAARFEGVQPEIVTAVTGTNGKTSVAHFVRSIWEKLGYSSASLGTLGIVVNEKTEDLHYTTPDPVLLHKLLKQLSTEGVTHTVLEASSHGLDQRRLDAVRVKVAAFTNLTRDHLDYHSDAKGYLDAKLGLVSRVVEDDGLVVLNADSEVFPEFEKAAHEKNLRVIEYGRKASDIQLVSTNSHAGGQHLDILLHGAKYQIDLPLAGEFQAMNILCALGIVVGAGANAAAAVAALETLENVPGRMERVATLPNGAVIYVDYAHTPDALETVLKALRPHAFNNVITVFGCGGDRDQGKRPQMGEIAHKLADAQIVTDDNPRSEEPSSIRAAILQQCPNATEIGDRTAAIAASIKMAEAGDVVLIAGKGHESGQIVGNQIIPFNDKDVILKLTEGGEAAND